MKNKQSGFTLIELIIVMVIVSTLFGMVVFNLIGTQKNSDLSSKTEILISDIASQQTKAMVGVGASGLVSQDYGIHFERNRYILFRGSTYSAIMSDNYTVNLDDGFIIGSILFPDGNLIFSYPSGTVSGYLNGYNYVTLEDTNNSNIKTIMVNRLGVVTRAD